MSDARKDTLLQIRQAGSGRRGKPNHFVNLSDSLLWEVYLRLRQGHSATAIAAYLHEHDAAPGTSPESTAKLPLRFRRKISHLLIGSPLDTSTSAVAKSSLPTAREVNRLAAEGSLEELLELRNRSRQALDRMLREEARTGISDKSIAQ